MTNEPTEAVCIAAQIWCRDDCKHIEMDSTLAYAFAEVLQEKLDIIDDLQDFAIWLTGCGYDFTQHPYFCKQRDKLLKGVWPGPGRNDDKLMQTGGASND